MASSAVTRTLLAAFVAGLIVTTVGVGLMLAFSAPVGGGCSGSTLVICTSPHQPTQFFLGAVLWGVGSLVGCFTGFGLRSIGWRFPWQRGRPAPEGSGAGACPSCGASNPPEGLVCRECGVPLGR